MVRPSTRQTADSISSTLFHDRNISFPKYPLLVPDIHTFAMPDGLGVQLRGLPYPVVLSGVTAREILPVLLPLLDGTRTKEEIHADCPKHIKPKQVDELLLILFRKGLIKENEPGYSLEPGGNLNVSVTELDKRQFLFWGRNLGITFANAQSQSVIAKLQNAKIVFIGAGLFGAAAFDTLRNGGCNNITAFEYGADSFFSAATNRESELVKPINGDEQLLLQKIKDALVGTDLLVTATRGASHSFFESINLFCLRERIKWLRGNDELGQVEIGPFVDPGSTGCYMCFRIRQSSSVEFAVEDELFHHELAKMPPESRNFGIGESVAHATMAGGMIAAEVTKILTVIAEPATTNAVVSMSFSVPFRKDTFLKVPRCSHCYSGAIEVSHE